MMPMKLINAVLPSPNQHKFNAHIALRLHQYNLVYSPDTPKTWQPQVSTCLTLNVNLRFLFLLVGWFVWGFFACMCSNEVGHSTHSYSVTWA